MKVFDISDKRNPRYVAAVETACGSHTHTLVPERRNVYVYVSSYAPNAAYPDCSTAARRHLRHQGAAQRPREGEGHGLPRAVPR